MGASIAMSAAADAKGIITEEEQITQVVWEGGHSQSQVFIYCIFIISFIIY